MSRVRLVDPAAPRERAELTTVAVTAAFEILAPTPGHDGVPAVGAETLRRSPGFGGEPGDAVQLLAGTPEPRPVLALGVGPAPVGTEALRKAAWALGAASVECDRVETGLALLGDDPAVAVRAVVEGFLAGAYRYAPLADPRPPVPELVLLLSDDVAGSADVRRSLRVAEAVADGVEWVRRLVDAPASDVTPQSLAEATRERAEAAGVAASVWSSSTLEERGFGGTRGVGAASAQPPLVVELTTSGGPPTLGLTGKGITFDSGGLNLKRDPAEIRWMKSDMAAAAAVAAAVCAAASLGADCRVRAILPLAENMVGRGALRPGDVLTHPDGRRTEVLDTDCEGRLVLADAVAYLAGSGVAEVVDVGTLTDGGGLGHLIWGCWGNDDALLADLVAGGARSGDPGWALPLRREYRKLLDSDVADVVNAAWDVPDSAILAATYLAGFADGVRWAHIDNGSTAYLDVPIDPFARGATGSPTAALVEFLLDRSTTRGGDG